MLTWMHWPLLYLADDASRAAYRELLLGNALVQGVGYGLGLGGLLFGGGDDGTAHKIVPPNLAPGVHGVDDDHEDDHREDDGGDGGGGGGREEEGRDSEAAVAGLVGGDILKRLGGDDREGHIVTAGGVEDDVHQRPDAERNQGQEPVAAVENEGTWARRVVRWREVRLSPAGS